MSVLTKRRISKGFRSELQEGCTVSEMLQMKTRFGTVSDWHLVIPGLTSSPTSNPILQ